MLAAVLLFATAALSTVSDLRPRMPFDMGVAGGFIEVRQQIACPNGYERCGPEGCMPSGSGLVCCSDGGFCQAGERCYGEGCCPVSGSCNIVPVTTTYLSSLTLPTEATLLPTTTLAPASPTDDPIPTMTPPPAGATTSPAPQSGAGEGKHNDVWVLGGMAAAAVAAFI